MSSVVSTTSPRLKELLDSPGIRQQTSKWLAERSKLITASDVASLLPLSAQTLHHYAATNQIHALKANPKRSINPWGNPKKFYREKLNPAAAATAKIGVRPLLWGNCLEPVAREWYERMYGKNVATVGLLSHKKYEWLGASVDGIVIEDECLIEIKCPFSQKPVVPEVPLHYWIQMQIQMEVLDIHRCIYLACAFQRQSTQEFLEDRGEADVNGAFVAVIQNSIDLKVQGGDEEYQQCFRSPPGLSRPQVVEWVNNLNQESLVEGGSTYYSYFRLGANSTFVTNVERNATWFEQEALPELERVWMKLRQLQGEIS